MSQQVEVYRALNFHKSSGAAKLIVMDCVTSSTILYILPTTTATEYIAFGNSSLAMSPRVFGSVLPGASDGGALGSTSLMWSDLFLASGAVINFNNGNVTLTHSAGVLTLSDACNIALGTTTGTKIGTATGQKLGLYNTAPTAQQTHVADAPAGGTGVAAGGWDTAANRDAAIASINAILVRLETLGIVASA
mgnify:CR=1 FL=1